VLQGITVVHHASCFMNHSIVTVMVFFSVSVIESEVEDFVPSRRPLIEG
jgi:hypothetical protein